jgi:heme/copper-type cytochrome/quinol oxidase subunit 2
MTYANPDQPWAVPPARRGNGMAVAALVLGILALVTCFTVVGGVILGILALVFGFIARGRAKRGEAAGGGMAIGGIVTGILGLVVAVALIALGASLLNSTSVKNLQTCLNNANGNQAAIQQCNQQFSRDLGGS